MKLAIAVAAEKAIPSTFVVWRGFRTAIEKAKTAGYQGVELSLRSVQEYQDEGISEILRKTGMQVSCVSTGQVFATDGLCFTHSDPEVRRKTVEVFRGLIQVAGSLGCCVNVGRARGSVPPGGCVDETEKLFCDGVQQLIPLLEECGVDLVIEPVNRYEINYLNNVDEACALLRKLDCKRLGVMPDVFHMNIEDDDICRSLERNAADIKYVHFADSNRHAPGEGHLNFPEIIATLKRIGYSGWCTVEILPYPEPDAAAFSAVQYLKPIFPAEA